MHISCSYKLSPPGGSNLSLCVKGRRRTNLPSRLLWVLLLAVGLQGGIDLLPESLHLTRVRQSFGVCEDTEK